MAAASREPCRARKRNGLHAELLVTILHADGKTPIKPQKERKKHESTNSVQKITNSADSAGAWLLCAARECGDHAGIRNRRVQQRLSNAGREAPPRSWGLPPDV